MPVNRNNAHVIRPAGRHLLTIGRELIQDPSAAVLELVKNAYDADSPDVKLLFQTQGKDGIVITVEDNGHGMSRTTVLDAWLVPSTSNKQSRHASPKGRIMQGRKGVGRFAASILGNILDMETVTEVGERTRVRMDWKAFEDADFLDEVYIPVATDLSKSTSGTRMRMTGGGEFRTMWNKGQFDKLKKELKKLVAPTAVLASDLHEEDDFTILLSIEGFGEEVDWNGIVEPFPVFELYDYRIFGTIEENGKSELIYHQKKLARNSIDERVKFDLENVATGCGRIEVDIRVFDRESASIGELIQRGLKDETGNYVGKLEAQRLLNDSCGIGVYRNGFRIRPLGDPDFDWLRLNQRRVQNPSMCIGSNQVIGFVRVQSEEQSGLIEKSARDGLKENNAYEALKLVTARIIAQLEARRFSLRKQVGLSRKVVQIEETLEKFFALRDVRKAVRAQLEKHDVSSDTIDSVMQGMDEIEQERNRQAEDILEKFSIYQAQAALGKLINIVLHEARRPLSFFRNNANTIDGWYRVYLKEKQVEFLEEKILPCIALFPGECKKLSDLFIRLDPLASGKREKRKNFLFNQQIHRICDLFKHEANKDCIKFELNGSDQMQLYGWIQDVDAIFSNLLDNSLYWMKRTPSSSKRIQIEWKIDDAGRLLHIDYKDSGPGIDEKLVCSGSIFDPGFSMKPDGHGLGLAIAGEASNRLNLKLKAMICDEGAWFRMEPIETPEQNEL